MTQTKRLSLNFNIDLLHGPIFKSLVLFALPMFISNIFQQLYNTVDTLIVGHYLGDDYLTAIGAVSPVYDLLIGFAFGIGMGLSIVTARCFGKGDENELKKSVAASIVIGIVSTIIITILAQIFLYPLLEVLKTPTDVIDNGSTTIINEGYSYISTITFFIIVMFAYNLCSGLLRSIGNSFMPLVFLVFSSCVNIVLDILFIGYLNFGIRGAAIATVISQGISVVLCIIYIMKKAKLLIPKKEHFSPNKSMYADMLGQGFSMGFMNCLVSAGSVILQSGINNIGNETIAGHIAARKLYQFSVMPVNALGMAGNTFISQNRGADNRKRIIKCVKYEYIYYVVSTTVIVIITQFFASTFIKLVSGSSNEIIIANGTRYLKLVCPFYVILGVVCGTRIALQSIGQKILPILSSIIEFVGKIIFAFIFIPKYEYTAVIFCEPIIWCIMAAYLVFAFWRNPYIRSSN